MEYNKQVIAGIIMQNGGTITCDELKKALEVRGATADEAKEMVQKFSSCNLVRVNDGVISFS